MHIRITSVIALSCLAFGCNIPQAGTSPSTPGATEGAGTASVNKMRWVEYARSRFQQPENEFFRLDDSRDFKIRRTHAGDSDRWKVADYGKDWVGLIKAAESKERVYVPLSDVWFEGPF